MEESGKTALRQNEDVLLLAGLCAAVGIYCRYGIFMIVAVFGNVLHNALLQLIQEKNRF